MAGMTSLKRQVILAGAMIFALALLGVAMGQWLAGREFVREQLAAHAQETATSLALAMTSALRDGDAVLVKTTVLPIFDRGYYRRIVIRDIEGNPVNQMERPLSHSGVPRWFAALARLESPRVEALVSAGWQQVGRVEVEGETEFALRQLWRGTLRALVWLLAVYALALTLLLLWLRRLLAPMASVERIAAAAAGRLMIVPIGIRTRVRELASFIAGFNRLAGMVNDRLTEEETRAERFRSEALTDRLTGLPNRLGLEAACAESPAAGWLGLVAIDGVEPLNQVHGYAAGDAYIEAMARCVRAAFPNALLARLRSATFAVIPDAGDEGTLRDISCQLLATMTRCAAGYEANAPHVSAGWVAAEGGETLPALLASADLALATAQAAGAGTVQINRTIQGNEAGFGVRALLGWVDGAIAAGSISLSLQAVVAVPEGKPVQTEAYLRLHDPDGRVVPAQRFMPLVQRERDTEFIDRAMFERLGRVVLEDRIPPGPVAANISADTFSSARLPVWMAAVLERWPTTCPLVLELREFDVVSAPDRAERFAAALRERGVAVAIDHFGLHAGGVAAMRRLLPQYVKLDASLSQGLDAVERRFQVEALVRAARSLEIPVWAQVFEAPGVLDLLAGMGIVGAQGYTLAAEQVSDG